MILGEEDGDNGRRDEYPEHLVLQAVSARATLQSQHVEMILRTTSSPRSSHPATSCYANILTAISKIVKILDARYSSAPNSSKSSLFSSSSKN